MLLRGNYQRRKRAIEKCAYTAIKYGYTIIGVQNGGWCASGPRALKTFAKYGRSNRCRNGKGGPWANDVYRIIGIKRITLMDPNARKVTPVLNFEGIVWEKNIDCQYTTCLWFAASFKNRDIRKVGLIEVLSDLAFMF